MTIDSIYLSIRSNKSKHPTQEQPSEKSLQSMNGNFAQNCPFERRTKEKLLKNCRRTEHHKSTKNYFKNNQ